MSSTGTNLWIGWAGKNGWVVVDGSFRSRAPFDLVAFELFTLKQIEIPGDTWPPDTWKTWRQHFETLPHSEKEDLTIMMKKARREYLTKRSALSPLSNAALRKRNSWKKTRVVAGGLKAGVAGRRLTHCWRCKRDFVTTGRSECQLCTWVRCPSCRACGCTAP